MDFREFFQILPTQLFISTKCGVTWTKIAFSRETWLSVGDSKRTEYQVKCVRPLSNRFTALKRANDEIWLKSSDFEMMKMTIRF